MIKEINFETINATFDTLTPLIRANGSDKESVERFVYYLLFISGAIGEQVGMDKNSFLAYAGLAFDRNTQVNKTN